MLLVIKYGNKNMLCNPLESADASSITRYIKSLRRDYPYGYRMFL